MENKRRILKKNKAIAGSMMIVAALLFVIARFQGGTGAWEWVSAFAEAAMIGALADWFAVVALFRHPLGVPIPHTAIIPSKKQAIADSLAEFIQDKFLATDALVSKLRGLNPAARLAGYLSSEKNAATVASGVTRVIGDSLGVIDDERVRKILHSAVNNRIEKADMAGFAGNILEFLRKDNRHQGVLDEVLKKFGAWLSIPESQDKIAGAIDKWVNTEYPLLGRMIPNREVFMKGAGEKIAARLNAFLAEVNADPDHELRSKFDETVTELIQRLKTDNDLRGKIEAVKQQVIANPAVANYVGTLWQDLKTWVHQDLEREDSRIREKLCHMAAALGRSLSNSAEMKESLNEHLENMVRKYADGLRSGFAKHVSGTIKQWEDQDFIDEIELSIGSDLQFIRMNGTLVGGMIGLLLHAISLLM